jgi:hypothetical protein
MKGSCCGLFFYREVKSSFVLYIWEKWWEAAGNALSEVIVVGH